MTLMLNMNSSANDNYQGGLTWTINVLLNNVRIACDINKVYLDLDELQTQLAVDYFQNTHSKEDGE